MAVIQLSSAAGSETSSSSPSTPSTGSNKRSSDSAGRNKKGETPVSRGSIPAGVRGPAGNSGLIHEGIVLLAGSRTLDLQAAERFRILKAKIERSNLARDPIQVITVTSAVPEEGKSVTSVNLARALAMDPQGKTLLIDCDLRKANVHKFFGSSPTPGLSDALVAGRPLENVIQSVEPGLDVITAGSPVIDAARALELPPFSKMIAEFKKRYRYVILDCPPVLLCPEPIGLTTISDGTLLVVRAWKTQKRLVRDAVNIIGRDKFFGAVMNDAFDSLNEYGYYGYYSYDHRRTKKSLPIPQSGNAPQATSKRGLLGGLFRKRNAG